MRADEIRALARRAGFAPGSRCWTCAAELPGQDGSSRGSWVAPIWGWIYSSSAIDIARERAGDLPCRFEVARIPPVPPGPFDVVLLLETMLAFPDKGALVREVSRALTTGGRFAFTMEEGLPLTEAGASADAGRRHGLADPAGRDAQLPGAGRAGRPLAG